MPKYSKVIYWSRRDFRITDNTALCEAAKSGDQVIPVYIISQWKDTHRWTGTNRQSFLCSSLDAFAKNLETIGGQLIFRQGAAVDELVRLIGETKADAIFYNRDPDPHGKHVQELLAEECAKLGVDVVGFKDAVLHEADEVRTKTGGPYRVFTPFGRNWSLLEKPAPRGKPGKLNTPSNIKSSKPPSLRTWKLSQATATIIEPGERAARKRMNDALTGPLMNYGAIRDIPFGQTTSRLSQDLRFGLISIRELYAKTLAASAAAGDAGIRDNYTKFITELGWREFYMAVLEQWPDVLEVEFNPAWRGLAWEQSDERLERFISGETGFPIVDAGVRELLGTGFMHNRVRMIVAMFLTKDLRINWRAGEQFFMKHLVDGEIASNNGGWQWSAGVGADAAPYFRIQNPWTQTKRYDPDGEYIKQWVPELRDVDPRQFSKPPAAGERIASDYPTPMVDHSEERQRTLEWFAKHKDKNSS
ncbi:MAG: deoxyribodipyrimidine photo-lyase [Verrucomicrobiota bacterium]